MSWRVRSKEISTIPRDVEDGIADLRDYTSSPTHAPSFFAELALSSLRKVYDLGDASALKRGYLALQRLKDRNSETFGTDIPIDHETVYKRFPDVVDSLIDAVERDWSRELKQQLGSRRR